MVFVFVFVNENNTKRAWSRAGLPSTKEPRGLLRSDNKRTHGLTLNPWSEGRGATWDVTVNDTVAHSYLSSSSAHAAEAAAERKISKYTDIACTHPFLSIAFETLGPINQVGADFISALSLRISSNTDNPREMFLLFRRLSVATQRFNSVCFTTAFGNTDVGVRHSQPRHTSSRCFPYLHNL